MSLEACREAHQPLQDEEGHWHCQRCGQPLQRTPHCAGCGGQVERLSACGAVSHFCPHCNRLLSRTEVQYRYRAAQESPTAY